MAGYFCDVDLEFPITRFFNSQTKDFLIENTDPNSDIIEELEIIVEVSAHCYFQPGVTYGPPEKCYPDEGEIEIFSAFDKDGKDWSDLLTPEEKDHLEERLAEKAAESEDDCFDDDEYDGADYDAYYDEDESYDPYEEC